MGLDAIDCGTITSKTGAKMAGNEVNWQRKGITTVWLNCAAALYTRYKHLAVE